MGDGRAAVVGRRFPGQRYRPRADTGDGEVRWRTGGGGLRPGLTGQAQQRAEGEQARRQGSPEPKTIRGRQ